MLDEKTDREFVSQTLQEHEQLRRLLGQVNQAISQQSESVDRVAELLTTLGDQITTHFQQEESEGLFEQVPAKASRLAERAQKLKDQHAQMQQEIVAMARWARENRTLDDWWEELEKRFRIFSKDLMRHESEENSLLQEAYGQDIGSQD